MNKLLSICIPTYNRAETLDQSLAKLFSNPEFDENLIEVIISDNCSTDNTKEVVAKYPLVRYYKNNENVRDCNFSIVLGYATGKYIRLFNDTLSFKVGALTKMLNRIEKHLNYDCNLFFYMNMFLNSNCKKELIGKKSLLKTVSFYPTWIANFGVWKKDFDNIKDKDRYAELQFVQVGWSYRIVENNKKTIIYFEDFVDVITPNKKGGYNIFDTFIKKYLFLLKQEKMPLMSFQLEKFRLCKYFVYPWLLTLRITDKSSYGFDQKGVYGILFKNFWYAPYFYAMLVLFNIRKIKSNLK